MRAIEDLEFLEPDASQGRQGKGPRWGTAALIAGIMAIAAALALQLSRQNAAQPQSGPAPDFYLKLFDNADFQLSDYRGQVMLVNFWASWCPPCRDEAPALQTLYDDYRDDGLVIVGVNMLESSQQKARAFIEEFGITYPNGEDIGQRITNLYRVQAPPESFLIDRAGHIHQFIIGAVNYDRLSGEIEALLGGGP